MGLFFKVLGDPTRLRILHALLAAELCVCDLGETLDMSVSAVSHQLSVLKRAPARPQPPRREGRVLLPERRARQGAPWIRADPPQGMDGAMNAAKREASADCASRAIGALALRGRAPDRGRGLSAGMIALRPPPCRGWSTCSSGPRTSLAGWNVLGRRVARGREGTRLRREPPDDRRHRRSLRHPPAHRGGGA